MSWRFHFFDRMCEYGVMGTETVGLNEVRIGDVIQAPDGADVWRRVDEIDRLPAARKKDGSGEYWTGMYFAGPIVVPAPVPGHDRIGDYSPGFNRFNFDEDEDEDELVTRRVAE